MASVDEVGTARDSSTALFDGTFAPPRPRPAVVPRTALLDRMAAAGGRIVSIVAPPGYGKTTLLAQWAGRIDSRVAWISLDDADNDPERLLTHAAAAVDRVGPVDRGAARRRRSGPPAAATVPRLTAAIGAMPEPVSLFFDHVELVENRECLDVIAALAQYLPAGSQLALATRREPPLPVARLRASGDLVEVGVSELAMDHGEAQALLARAGVEVDDGDATELVARTEGWPVGLYLAALAVQAGGDTAGVSFSGDDRLMADYLRSELLSRLSDAHVTFLTRSSVLDRMSGRLCDAVLETAGAAATLEELERSNLLLVALDRRREWYRYHRLFRDLLRAELQRREPELVGRLHERAANWYEANGLPELAIEHGQQSGDIELVTRLVFVRAQTAYAEGHAETLRRWVTWLEVNGHVDSHPAAAIVGAVLFTLIGQPAHAERWAAAAEQGSGDALLPDGSTLEGWRALLRVYQCRNGIGDLRENVRRALEGLAPNSEQHAVVALFEGLAYVYEGHTEFADAALARAVDAATSLRASAAEAFGLATRALMAADANAWDNAAAHAHRSLAVVEDHELEGYAFAALAYIAAARVELHRREIDKARDLAARAARLRPMLTYLVPHASVQSLLELVRVYVSLADVGGAREVLRQARDILQTRPDLAGLREQADELTDKLETMRTGSVGASSLTTAELRLVPLLSTHLTFPEIGERLHVSRHTVKTQAISIYQKLAVSSRSEAIERMEAIGLLPS